MASALSLDRQLNVTVPEMETIDRDVTRLLDVYGKYLKTKEKGTLMEFQQAIQMASYMGRRSKAITNRLKQEGTIYPRD